MPPLPSSAMISSWGNNLAKSPTCGGTKVLDSGSVAVVTDAPCLSRQAGHKPPRAPEGRGAPHWGQCAFIPESSLIVSIHTPQKQNREFVTKILSRVVERGPKQK